MKAIIKPANSNGIDCRKIAIAPMKIHVRWKVQQGRQLKGFLSKKEDILGNTIGSQLPIHKDITVDRTTAKDIIIAFIPIDKWHEILSQILSLSLALT